MVAHLKINTLQTTVTLHFIIWNVYGDFGETLMILSGESGESGDSGDCKSFF